MMSSRVRICVVDDQAIVREGLCTLLRMVEDFEVVGEASGGEQALELVSQCMPDVLLLDLRMPGTDGVQVLQRLQRASYAPPVLALTTFDDEAMLLSAIKAGARGVLLKDVTLTRLAHAIRTIASGGTMMQPVLTERLRDELSLTVTRGVPPSADLLTPREIEVLRLVTGGYSNREIGEALGTTEGTVKNQISSILSKLGVRDRTQAAMRGIERGLI